MNVADGGKKTRPRSRLIVLGANSDGFNGVIEQFHASFIPTCPYYQFQLGGAALTAKLADDLAELAGGTAIGAGSARLIGAGAASTFFVFQKGREVKLRPGDTLEAEFDLQSQRIPIN